jgi:hypothetical protein
MPAVCGSSLPIESLIRIDVMSRSSAQSICQRIWSNDSGDSGSMKSLSTLTFI